MAESQILLTEDERRFLAELLESIRKETLVEEHRTDSFAFRKHVQHKIDLLTGIQQKLGRST
jgi:hypothetical protein